MRAAALACVAGYVDSYTLLHYAVYTSFMSGNTTSTGLAAGEGRLAEAGHHLLPIPSFVIGVFLGTLLLRSWRRSLRVLWAAVGVALTVGMAASQLLVRREWAGILLFGLAMGVLNSTITHVGGETVSVAFVTGDLNRLGHALAQASRRAPVADSRGPGDTHVRRAAMLTGVWASFLLGTVLAGAAIAPLGSWALLPPVLLLLVVVATK